MKKKSIVVTTVVLLLLCFGLFPRSSFAQTDCEYPNILITLDKSGSMRHDSKWTHAKNAINTILNSTGNSIAYGLLYFPTNTSCSVSGVAVGVAPNTSTAIMNSLNSNSPNGWTPMGNALDYIIGYSGIHDPAKRNYVLFITDGCPEGCGDGNPVPRVTTLHNQGIKTFVVGFGSGVCESYLNDMAVAGGTQRSPSKPYYYQADNSTELNAALQNILQIVTAEICDGKDQDCDGLIDEDPNNQSQKLSKPCSTQCGSGWQWCTEGAWGPCDARQPGAEICDNIDNDCDGQVDENLTRNCSTICESGTETCSAGQWLNCTARQPTTEICDGADNNCDGFTDMDPADTSVELTRPCISECGGGREHCIGATWSACDATQPVPEVCDGADNDCDGQVDEPADLPHLQTDVNNCGQCFNVCPVPDNSYPTCIGGICGYECIADFHKENDLCVPDCKPTNGGIEICDFIDNDCDDLMDEDDTGVEFGLRDLCNTCDFPEELCNGKDDNCDKEVDEGFNIGEACDTGFLGVCAEGFWECDDFDATRAICKQKNLPYDEVCDNLDNNCDGEIDEWLTMPCHSICEDGNEVCVAGEWLECDARQPENEICNGLDDDCNGLIDDGNLDAGIECETGELGVCGMGHMFCVSGMQSCLRDIEPTNETCDGLDNDCDGLIDEDLEYVGKVCSTGSPGICAYGTWQCVSGLEICQPEEFGIEEICDGADNDCDGLIDEDLINACGACGPLPEEICDGIDNDCNGEIDEGLLNDCGECGETPEEVCDGVDNNCDGNTDEGTLCPSGQDCVGGFCERQCPSGECPPGKECRLVDGKKVCVGPCFDANCDEGFVCEEATGNCVDACAGVSCESDEVCENGDCIKENCEDTGCPDGEKCLNGDCVSENCLVSGCEEDERCTPEGECEYDPCEKANCRDDQLCRDGSCVDSCGSVSCAADETCIDGNCIKDPCAMKACKKGEVCVEGKCVEDLCWQVDCDDGMVCDAGECIGDPCLQIHCPIGELCHDGQCVSAIDPENGGHGETLPEESFGECVRHTDCEDGEICVDNYCEFDDGGDDDDDNDDPTKDTDNDGIPDIIEKGDDPENPVDTDNDGIPDYKDKDSDGDGLSDSLEAGADPTDPVDSDDDGIPDYLDEDSDNDTKPDWWEGSGDIDGDGIPNYLDGDSDGDGGRDAIDDDYDGDYIIDEEDDDANGNGVNDEEEFADRPPLHDDDDNDDTTDDDDLIDDDDDDNNVSDDDDPLDGPDAGFSDSDDDFFDDGKEENDDFSFVGGNALETGENDGAACGGCRIR